MNTALPISRVSTQPMLRTQPQREPVDREGQLIARAQSGDLDAFNELVLAYQEMIFRQACWMLGDAAAAEDAAQEAFLLAYSKLHTFRGGPFKPWLLRIAINHCIDQIRRLQRRPQVALDQVNEHGEEYEPAWMVDPAETPENAVERFETGQAIAHAVNRLAPEYRTLVILVDLQELDYAEVSSVLRIPVGTVKSRLSRARRQLRAALMNTFRTPHHCIAACA